VVAGPGGDIGRGASGAGARGGSFDFACLAFGFAARLAVDLAVLAPTLALRADFLAAPRLAFTALRLRAGAARLTLRAFLALRPLAFRLFAIMTSR
jgi:hypothetical protein